MFLHKWKIIAALSLTAAGALASGLAVLLQKLQEKEETREPEEKAAKPLMTGSYSFISGYEDAVTVELCLDYDPEQFSFAIVEDEFLNYSGASHVAILYGSAFNLQLEYAAYYHGEDFPAHIAALREKYPTHGEIVCGALAGVWVLDGDNIAIHFPIPEDRYSYLLVTVQKTADFDGAVTELPAYPPLRALLGSIRFRRG